MDSFFPFVLSLILLCQVADGAMALHIPLTRASLTHLEAPGVVTLEMGFFSLFVMGKRSRASTLAPSFP